MKRFEKTIVTSALLLPIALGGCTLNEGGGTSNESKLSPVSSSSLIPISVTANLPDFHLRQRKSNNLRVGNGGWVKLALPATQHYRNGDESKTAGDECFTERGAKLQLLNSRRAKYVNLEALGTECPDGSVINISAGSARADDVNYRSYKKRETEVTAQIRTMDQSGGVFELGLDTWVDVINPDGVEQQYANGSERLVYGDTCIANGKVQEVGHLKDGELVVRVENPEQLGTPCPTDTLFLATRP